MKQHAMRVVLRRAGKQIGTVFGPRRVLIVEKRPYPSVGLAVEIDGATWVVTKVEPTEVLARLPLGGTKG